MGLGKATQKQKRTDTRGIAAELITKNSSRHSQTRFGLIGPHQCEAAQIHVSTKRRPNLMIA